MTNANGATSTFDDSTLYQFPELAKLLAEESSTKTASSGTPKKPKRMGPQVIARPKIAIPPAASLPAVLLDFFALTLYLMLIGKVPVGFWASR